jgi:hypothetical protein
MEIGTTKKSVFTALLKVQEEIKNPENSANNPFAKSKYAPLNEILNMVRPLFNKNGLILIQNTGTTTEGAYVQTVIAHKDGEVLEFDKLCLKDARMSNPVQAMGSAITYGRRYQLTSILGIAGEEDTDGETSKNGPANGKQQPEKEYKAKASNNNNEDKGDQFWRALKFENELYAKVINEFDEKEELNARLIRNKAADMVGEQKLTADEKKEIYVFIRDRGK